MRFFPQPPIPMMTSGPMAAPEPVQQVQAQVLQQAQQLQMQQQYLQQQQQQLLQQQQQLWQGQAQMMPLQAQQVSRVGAMAGPVSQLQPQQFSQALSQTQTLSQALQLQYRWWDCYQQFDQQLVAGNIGEFGRPVL